jgi:hypothetical protein
MELRRDQRCRRDRGRPAQRTPIMIVKRRTGLFVRGTAHAGRHRPRFDTRATGQVMMEISDSDLHAKRKKRQPKQSQSQPRDGHRSPMISPSSILPILCHYRGDGKRGQLSTLVGIIKLSWRAL